jgi:uncharacterized protein (TIGR03000 family)
MPSASATGNTATIVVTLPGQSRLTIGDYTTPGASDRHIYVTSPIADGKTEQVIFKAQVVRDGKTETVTRTVTVKPGEETTVSLAGPASAVSTASK